MSRISHNKPQTSRLDINILANLPAKKILKKTKKGKLGSRMGEIKKVKRLILEPYGLPTVTLIDWSVAAVVIVYKRKIRLSNLKSYMSMFNLGSCFFSV